MGTTKLGKIIRKLSLFFGIALLGVSIFLSYDGFDGTVNGTNDNYKAIAVFIGLVFAITVSIIQFIFTNEYRQLNPTLIAVGVLSYLYSIYTNYLGAKDILGMEGWMALFTAAMSDIVAEPMISYGLGESLVGDLLGNLWKAIGGDDEDKNKAHKQPFQQNAKSQYQAKHKPAHLGVNSSHQASRPAQRVLTNRPQYHTQQNFKEPIYHPIGFNLREEEEDEELGGALE